MEQRGSLLLFRETTSFTFTSCPKLLQHNAAEPKYYTFYQLHEAILQCSTAGTCVLILDKINKVVSFETSILLMLQCHLVGCPFLPSGDLVSPRGSSLGFAVRLKGT